MGNLSSCSFKATVLAMVNPTNSLSSKFSLTLWLTCKIFLRYLNLQMILQGNLREFL